MTLREVYAKYHRSSAHARATLAEFNNALCWWEALTDDPPVEAVDKLRLREFVDAALSLSRTRTRNPYSRATVHKWLRALMAILHAAEEAELIGRAPRMPRLRCPKRPIVFATPAEISRIYEQRHVARWPRRSSTGIRPALWWGTLVCFLYNVGSRRGEWWRGLPLSAVDLNRRLVTTIDNKDGSVEIKAINPMLAAHLQEFIAAAPERELLFPSPANTRALYRTWHAIQAAAGISVKRPPGSELKGFYGFHELRKSCGTGLCSLNPHAAMVQLGHANIATTIRHYAAVGETLRRATDALEQPAAFADIDEPLRVVG